MFRQTAWERGRPAGQLLQATRRRDASAPGNGCADSNTSKNWMIQIIFPAGAGGLIW